MKATNILIVEDDKIQRLLTRAIIDNGIRRINEVETAHEGLRFARENPVDILLLDLGLPGYFDGFSLCEALRKDYRHANLKVIVISGYDDPQDHAEADRLHIDHYLAKPVNASKLRAILDDLEK